MDDIIQIRCPFCRAILSVKNQPKIESKNVTCPVCKHKYPFPQFKRIDTNKFNVNGDSPSQNISGLTQTPRIFISYKRVDKEQVFKLKKEIEAQTGEMCWIDLDGIESDEQFKNVIINAIKQCEVVLFMYSKAHASIVDFEKDWTVRELNFAAAKNKRIVFINLDGTPLTDEFRFDYGLKQQVEGQSSESMARLISD